MDKGGVDWNLNPLSLGPEERSREGPALSLSHHSEIAPKVAGPSLSLPVSMRSSSMTEIIHLRPIWGRRTRTLTSSPTITASSLLFPLLNRNKPSWHSHPRRPNKRQTRLVARFRYSIAKESSPTMTTAPPAQGVGLDCVIVGAGISGLCIAQVLATEYADAGFSVVVTEARDRVGGNITTVERDGYLWKEGPNSFQPSDPILTISVESGLKDDLVLGDPNAPCVGHEESVKEFVCRNLGDVSNKPFCSGGNFWSCLACWIFKAIASELMVIGAGVYAGNPSKLSMKAAFGKVWKLAQVGGSIIGGTFKAIQERNSTPKRPGDP
ncbi:Amine oxidase [Dillenia turbinata]|uniref:Amine oxidase n=1 Tax=Dillenia turbinata TaxID=194707 RepID=A0AAN8ZGJ1_9MAGN